MTQQMEEMSITEHLSELRKRLIYVLSIFVLGLIAGFFVADPVYQYLTKAESAKGFVLHAFSFWDGIGIYMKIAGLFSLIITLPFTVYQIWKFVSPGLKPRERKATLKYVPYVFLLFLTGMAFSYYVIFPMALAFTTAITEKMGLVETYGMKQYFSFLFGIVLPVSLLFELPLLIMFLTGLRILNPIRLRKMRRVAYFVLIFIAVVITPPDFISDLLVMIPLLLLYEISVLLSAIVYRKQLAADEEIESRYVRAEDKKHVG
ncbi:twin-arginine translocase subunit TatC [Paenibacillus sp. FSL R7-0198]|uniref:twin-arginine translocase subunit TatC n=1 Tax=unclassified Paenibacillus TaxID=185978 RepID=UPI001786E414|nr:MULTISPECIES: twin-arginine translocase subunit TatC [unclassified Paenibacillus]MBD8838788.1 twin-arginine translocase subunit TatC [Paenibacillus sp. CFBP 13594]WJM09598.1 twin-arginine translocase subunit TatC [Paenibacillus sp. PK1-4R]